MPTQLQYARMDNGEVPVGVFWQNYSTPRSIEWWVKEIGVNWPCYNHRIEGHPQDWPRYHALSKRLNEEGFWHRTSRMPAFELFGFETKSDADRMAFDQVCKPYLHGWFMRDEFEDKFKALGTFSDNPTAIADEIVAVQEKYRNWIDLPIHYNFNGGNVGANDKPLEIAAQQRIAASADSVSLDQWWGTAAIKYDAIGNQRYTIERRFEAVDLLTERTGKAIIGYVDTGDQKIKAWPLQPGERWESRAPTEAEVERMLNAWRKRGVIFFPQGNENRVTNGTSDAIAAVLKAMVPAIKNPDRAKDEQIAKLTKELAAARNTLKIVGSGMQTLLDMIPK